jgi:hypothetical protein
VFATDELAETRLLPNALPGTADTAAATMRTKTVLFILFGGAGRGGRTATFDCTGRDATFKTQQFARHLNSS